MHDSLQKEKMIRGWRVRSEGPGYVVYFDPAIENVVLYDGPDLAYEVHEGREASVARDVHQKEMEFLR